MNIIFNIEGGIGKSVMATAVCEVIKKQYPNDDLIVLTAYPEVFMCNPHVTKCFMFNNLHYFYKDYVENQRVNFFLHNPYLETDFILRKEHFIKTWCKMFGLKYNNEQPKIYLTEREVKFYSNQFKSEKPIMVIQTNGGAQNQVVKYSWARDIPYDVAQKVVDTYSKEYEVFHIRREDQIVLTNTKSVSADFRALVVLISLSKKRLFMDSFAQHVAKALELESVVLWIANTPNQFGYKENINIEAKEETLEPEIKNSLFSKYDISGSMTEFPYNSETEIFDVEEIIEALKK